MSSIHPKVIFTQLFVLTILIAGAQNQNYMELDPTWPDVNGSVRNIAYDESKIFLSGNFNMVGAAMPYGAKVNTETGLADLNTLRPDGIIRSVISDGNGGWFLGGDFNHIGDQPRTRIAQIDASGNLTNFAQNLGLNGAVSAMELDGNNLYVGGSFTQVGQFLEGGGFLIGETTGLPVMSQLSPDGTIYAVLEDGNGGFFVSGQFERVGTNRRSNFAHILSDGTLDTWNPGIYGLAKDMFIRNDILYLVGNNFICQGVSKGPIIAFDLATGSMVNFGVTISGGLIETSLVVGDVLYVGGGFTQIMGNNRNNLAAINLQNNSLTSWNPGCNGSVYAMVEHNGIIYIGGAFTQLASTNRNYLGSVSATNGQLTTWNPNANQAVTCVEKSQTALYVGGNFTSMSGQTRSKLCSFDLGSGSLSSWNPNVSGGVVNGLKTSATSLFIAGSFTTASGQSRSGVASFNITTGVISNWNPSFQAIPSGSAPNFHDIKVSAGFIYVGGYKVQASNAALTRNRIACIDITNSTCLAWNPNASNVVRTIKKYNGKLYVGGDFMNISSTTRRALVSYNLNDGSITSWLSNVQGSVYSFCFDNGKVFVGGDFTSAGGAIRYNAACYDVSTGLLTNWFPNINGLVASMQAYSNSIYLAGSFSSVSGQNRAGLASINSATGSLNAWNPTKPTGSVWMMKVLGDRLFAVGNFHSINDQVSNNVCVFNLLNGSRIDWAITNGEVYDIGISGTSAYLGGGFTIAGAKPVSNFLVIDKMSKQPIYSSSINLGSNTPFTVYNGLLYLTQSNNLVQARLISNLNTIVWSASCDIYNPKLMYSNGRLYVYGQASVLNPLQAMRVFNATTGSELNGPMANGTIDAVAVDGQNLYVGGNFSEIEGMPRSRLARFVMNGNSITLDNWSPNCSGPVYGIATSSDKIYVGGNFQFMNGLVRNGLASFTKSNGVLTSWSPNQGNTQTLLLKALGNELIGLGQNAISFSNNNFRSTIYSFDLTTSVLNDRKLFPYALTGINNFNVDGDNTYVGLNNFPPTPTSYYYRQGFGVLYWALPQQMWYLDQDNDGYFGNSQMASASPGVGWTNVMPNSGGGDCNDNVFAIRPGSPEICNGVDDDCDGSIDEGLSFANYYSDTDGDGYGAGAVSNACSQPANTVTNNTDCAPNDNTKWQTADRYVDADGDGFGTGSLVSVCYGASIPSGYSTNNTDCNDNNASLNSITTEICNNFDDDCNGIVDNGLTFVNYYNDIDSDGFGAGAANNSCQSPGASFVTNNTDCNDNNSLLNSITTEICNNFDDDCNGIVDNGLTFVNYYNDIDSDGFGAGAANNACQSPGASFVTNNTDCNDNNSLLNYITTEICNNFDDDCNGIVDNGLAFVNYYNDIDSDGFGAGAANNACQSPGISFVTNNTDCNDNNPALNSIAAETCNSFDDDCDGTVDNGLNFVNYYNDIDGDGYGSGTATNACQSPGVSYVLNNNDCNDNNATIKPGATELCTNGIDDNCNGQVNENCSQGGVSGDNPVSSNLINNIPAFAYGVQNNFSINLAQSSNSIESPGSGNDVWYRFVATGNAARIALTGSSTVADDNAIELYSSAASPGTVWVPLSTEDDVHPGSQGTLSPASDGGSEILYYSNLVPTQTYYLCLRNVNDIAGTCNLSVSFLRGSQADILPYTGGTGIYNNTCAIFKSAFRSQSSGYVVRRWQDQSAANAAVAPSGLGQGIPSWSYAIPPQSTGVGYTMCQLGKILPANFSSGQQTYYVTVDVIYNLKDAAGNNNTLTAYGTVASPVKLNAEAPLTVGSNDLCSDGFKRTTAFITSNRSVCGTARYDWKFKMAYPTQGLPIYIAGGAGAERLVGMGSIPGIANGQRYDVWVRAAHLDGVSYSVGTAAGSPWQVNTWFPTTGGCPSNTSATCAGNASCVKTIGNAGMVLAEQEYEEEVNAWSAQSVQLFPNPNAGVEVMLSITGMEGEINIEVFDAMGRWLQSTTSYSEGHITPTLSFEKALSSGLYEVRVSNGQEHRVVRMVVGR